MDLWGLFAAIRLHGGQIQDYDDPDYEKSYMISCKGKTFHLRGTKKRGVIMSFIQWEVGLDGNYSRMHINDIRDFIVGTLPPDKM